MEGDSISTTVVPTVGAGRMERHMAMASVPDPKAKASIRGPGPTVSRQAGFTRGPVAIPSKGNGCRAKDTASAWKPKAGGSTEGSGHTGSRAGTACATRPRPGLSTRERGRLVFRMDTVWRHMLMEVRPAPYILLFKIVVCVTISL